MTSNFHKYILCLLVPVLFFSCKKKKKEAATVQEPPTIEIVSLSPLNVKEFKDSIIIVIKYKDVNGDLGDENPDELSLEIKDSRLPKADYYHLQPLAPDIGKDIPIEGEVRIKLNSMFLLGAGTIEQSILTIKLKDRAGTWSNEATAQPLTITQ